MADLLFTYHCDTPLGGVTLAGDGECLTGLWFDGQRHFPAGLPQARAGVRLPVFAQTERWLQAYFSGRTPTDVPPLRPEGTDFEQRVWARLREIPWAQTVTYGAIARALGTSARAVGGAVGRNPICLIIPCHRVVGADGSLTGYAGGLDRKRRLLTLEGVELK